MDTQPRPPGESWCNTGCLVGSTSNNAIVGTRQERRNKLVHHDDATAATEHITLDAYLTMALKTRSSKYKMQHAVGCQCIDIDVNGRQLTV